MLDDIKCLIEEEVASNDYRTFSSVADYHNPDAYMTRVGEEYHSSAPGELVKRIAEKLLQWGAATGLPVGGILHGFNFGRVWDPYRIAHWLIRAQCQGNIAKSIAQLRGLESLDYIPAREFVAVSGIEPIEPTSIGPYRLEPFQELVSSFEKDWLQGVPRTKFELPAISPLGTNEPTIVISRSKKIRPRIPPENHSSEFIEPDKDLIEFAYLLCLVSKGAPNPVAWWGDIERTVPAAHLSGRNPHLISELSAPPRIWGRSLVLPKISVSEKEKALIEGFFSLPVDSRKPMQLALRRLSRARLRHEIEDKALELGIAIEAMFLTDKDKTRSLTYLISLRGALVEDSAVERSKTAQILKKCYELRSRAAHGSSLSKVKPLKLSGERMSAEEVLSEGGRILITFITKCIRAGGIPDWENLDQYRFTWTKQ